MRWNCFTPFFRYDIHIAFAVCCRLQKFVVLDIDHEIDVKQHIKNAVLFNYCIVDTNGNWSQLSFLEAFDIKKFPSIMNKGLKASMEL